MSCHGGGDGERSFGGVTAVAIVGRDNEPLYLRSDLCDCNTTASSLSGSESLSTGGQQQQQQHEGDTLAHGTAHNKCRDGDDEKGPLIYEENQDAGSSFLSNSLLGRFQGAVRTNNAAEKSTNGQEDYNRNDRDNDDNDREDPFGFFENNSNPLSLSSNHRQSNTENSSPHMIPAMPLTQQLVLHASLDRFEELAARSNIRWRMPGSSNSATAMWMGLLCQVEERWNVYGYLTNTGIKFMILVENMYLNQDGSYRQQDCAPQLMVNNSFPSTSPNSGNREADLKKMFAELHELYVRHTMNPFSKLRSPIQSRMFNQGVIQMAQSFNASALEKVLSLNIHAVGDVLKNTSDGLQWM